MKQRITLEEMLARVKAKWGDLIIYVGGYTYMHKKCMWKCARDGYTWFARPNDIIRGTGCPECGLKKRIKRITTSLDKMLKQVQEVWGDLIEYIGGYTKKHSKCWWRCTVDGTVWEARPHDILAGHGCPVCGIKSRAEKKALPLVKMLEMLFNVWGDLIEYVSGYVNTKKDCLFRCKICGHVWKAKPDNVIRGKTGCPKCVIFSMERPVLSALYKKNIIPKHNKALDGSNYNGSSKPLRVDFIIETPKGILAIETDGEQHFHSVYGEEALKSQQERDKHKDKILKEKGYILIRVTSSPTHKWGTEKHITLAELLHLIEIGIDENGNVNLDIFRPYDFNLE